MDHENGRLLETYAWAAFNIGTQGQHSPKAEVCLPRLYATCSLILERLCVAYSVSRGSKQAVCFCLAVNMAFESKV